MNGKPTRVALVEDHDVVRHGIEAILRRCDDIEVVGSFRAAEDLIRALASDQIDVVLLDHRLAGMSGLSACQQLARGHPGVASILLTNVDDDAVIHAALVAGARGYLLKSSDGEEIIRAVRAVARGGAVLSPEIVPRVIGWARNARAQRSDDSLAPNEVLALSFVSEGLTNREIGRRLGVSEASVKLYLRAAMRKLGVSERSEAVAVGIKRGVI